jgi:type 1 fimbria pilin
MATFYRLAAPILVAAIVLTMPRAVSAASPPQDVTLTISGQILEPAPCTISGTGENGSISVDFGNEVMTTRIDGLQYRQSVQYDISCSGMWSKALMLRIVGTAAGFGSGYLQSSVADLALVITEGATPVPINSMLNFTYPGAPALFVTPVARPGATLKGQPFTATAIMQVFYQ